MQTTQNENISVSVKYALFPGDVFPTFISHLFGGSVLPIPFAKAVVANDGTSQAAVSVASELVGYGQASVEQETIASGETIEVTTTPSLDYESLFKINSPIPGNAKTTVNVGGEVIWEETKALTFASKNTMFWAIIQDGVLMSLRQFLCVFVTPHDKAKTIDKLLSNASLKMPTGSIGGYQEAQAPQVTLNVGLGEHEYEQLFLLPGNEIVGELTSVSGGTGKDIDLYVFDQVNYNSWSNGGQADAMVYLPNSPSGTTFFFVAGEEDVYYVVYYNSPDNWVSRNVSRIRTASHMEIVSWHASAIFDTLKAMGVTYVNTPADFFEAAQHIKYPAETLGDLSGNCVDGAVLFASAFEAIGMKAHVAIVPGHAFVAVELWDDEARFVPVETTMVGGPATAAEAIQKGLEEWSQHFQQGTLEDVSVPACRAAGITPAPM